MHHLAGEGDRRARAVERLTEDRERLIGAILLGNNAVNILASALATSVLISVVGDAGVAFATIGMTLVILVFAEVLPKTYAIRDADRVALKVAPVLGPIVWLLSPIVGGGAAGRLGHVERGGGLARAEDGKRGPRRSCAAPSPCRRRKARWSSTSATCSTASSTWRMSMSGRS